MTTTRRDLFLQAAAGIAALRVAGILRAEAMPATTAAGKRPNILFCLADDWSWPHVGGAGGDKTISTPTFDRLAKEGVLFSRAYCCSPSCSPSRASILTGQKFWRLEEGANLWSTLPAKFAVYTDILAAAGYHVGSTRKGWGPGNVQAGGRTVNAAGKPFKTFEEFLSARPKGAPFCFWFGSYDPHRPYDKGSGVRSSRKLSDVVVPPYLPDSDETRGDLLDYCFEVERFDREVGQMLAILAKAGELDNTLVVMTGDNGLPFPRAKSNIYDAGTHQPLAIRWGAAKGGRVVDDFVGFDDFAPTFLEAAGCKAPPPVTGGSLVGILIGGKAGRVEDNRDHVFVGMERHTAMREGGVGYPCRAIRTDDFLYIRNFAPDRWPAGDPPEFGDIDGGPTKDYLLAHRDDAKVKPLFELACAKRPAEELYDLKKDPHEMTNVAGRAEYAAEQKLLAERLTAYLKETSDPRVVGGGEKFDAYPYRGSAGAGKPRK